MLLPAAKENVITSAERRIACEPRSSAKARTVPPRHVADAILADKRIFVIPDILANAGGVTVSYFEWVQDRQGYFWNEQLVNDRLEEIMVNSFQDVVAYAEKHGVNNRTGRVHAGPRSRGVRDQTPRNLRLSRVADCSMTLSRPRR